MLLIQKEKNEQMSFIKWKLKRMTTFKKLLLTHNYYDQSLMTTVEQTPRNKSSTYNRDKLKENNIDKNNSLPSNSDITYRQKQKHKTQLTIQIPSLVVMDNSYTSAHLKIKPNKGLNYNFSEEGKDCRSANFLLSTNNLGQKGVLKTLFTQKNITSKKKLKRDKGDSYVNEKFNNSKSYCINEPKRKLLQVNINSSKMTKMNALIAQGKLKRGSITDRLIFKALKPEENIEDYYQSGDFRPGDRYAALKRQLMKQRTKMTQMIHDIKKTQSMSESLLKVQVSKLYFRKNNKTKN